MPISLDKITVEKRQVIQTLQNERDEIGLIPGKSTLIRLFLRYDDAKGIDEDILVSGSGDFYIGGQKANNEPIPSRGAAVIKSVPPGWEEKQDILELSLNFEVPRDCLYGDELIFKLTHIKLVGGDEEAYAGEINHIEAPITFVGDKNDYLLRIHTIGLRYRALARDLHYTPARIEFDYMKSFITRTFPISELIWNETVIDADPGFEPPFRYSDNRQVQQDWKSKINISHMQLMAIRARNIAANTGGYLEAGGDDKYAINKLTHYYGMVFDPEGIFDGDASDVPIDKLKPETVSVGQAETHSGYYGAHEIAHTLGRLHPGFPVDEQPQEFYPDKRRHRHNKGLISEEPVANPPEGESSFGHVGLDYGDDLNPMRTLPWRKWYDVMTYEDDLWVSEYTYNGLKHTILNENALLNETGSFAGGPEELIQIIGEYDDTSRMWGQFRYVFPTVTQLENAEEESEVDADLLENYKENRFCVVTYYSDGGSSQTRGGTYYLNPLDRESAMSVTSRSVFQLTVPKFDDTKVLSEISLQKEWYTYARKKLKRAPVDFENLDLVVSEKTARLVRSSIDENANDYFLSINVERPDAAYRSDTTYTVQVKPFDLSGHIGYIANDVARDHINERISQIESGEKQSEKERKIDNLHKIRDYLLQYCDSFKKYAEDFGNVQRQKNKWHTIAVDVETPKNIYLDKELLLLNKSLFSLNLGPFKKNGDKLELIENPKLESDYKSLPDKGIIAFQLRVFCKIGIDERQINSHNEGIVFYEDLGKHPESADETNLSTIPWSGDSSFVALHKTIVRKIIWG